MVGDNTVVPETTAQRTTPLPSKPRPATGIRQTDSAIPTRMLVLGMAHEDGSILSSELIPVAQACGQSPDQIRSCLRRLVGEGLFVRTGAGLAARFEATERGMAALGADLERTRLAYGQDAAGRGWDRQWRLVGFAISEGRRAARDSFRDRLLALGGASLQGGLYVSPHNWHKDVKAEAERLGVMESVTLATTDDLEIAGDRDPRALAARLWPLESLRARYDAFLERYAALPDTLAEMQRVRHRIPDTAFLPAALAMAVAFAECFQNDPLLPPELLPRPWPGRAARDVLARSRRIALSTRESPGRPALFRLFDEAIDAIP